jgi:hypothetical protein
MTVITSTYKESREATRCFVGWPFISVTSSVQAMITRASYKGSVGTNSAARATLFVWQRVCTETQKSNFSVHLRRDSWNPHQKKVPSVLARQ